MKTINETITKEQALANHLDIELDGVAYEGCCNLFNTDDGEYMVLTNDEADEAATEDIKESLWAFIPSFLASETGYPVEVFTAISTLCEDANEAIIAMVERSMTIKEFADIAVEAELDGRGHFLSGYDGAEIEQDGYYIYRTN